MDRVALVHEAFLRKVRAGDLPAGADPAPGLEAETAVAIFRAQCRSRALDREARALQKAGQGFYTIGSSGHEGMAAVALALRPDDPAFLHYRDGAFQLARAGQVPGQTPVLDMALSFACARDDPVSGGRHKVLGSRALMIPPQTSTIASHLPKAVGAAFSLGLARRHPPEHRQFAEDAVVMCAFGDASANHASAQAAMNAAGWAAVQSTPLPLVFVCEDNGIGISVKSPPGWIAAMLQSRPGLDYIAADGLDLYDTYHATRRAAGIARTRRRPVVLHLRMVRLYGHAGADVASSYLGLPEIEADEANDPLLHSVRLLDAAGALSPDQALAIHAEAAAEAEKAAAAAAARPRLATAAEVMATIVPPPRICRPPVRPDPVRRAEVFGTDARAMDAPQTLAKCLNWALTDVMLGHPETVAMGEDVGRKGGVYGVTQRLQARFGPDRVMDTLLDEQSILGLAIGLAHNGFLPIPEIQFLAYLHTAEDQLRGEAATLPFFSQGQFTNPMVLRIAGLGYQKGFGGHFHNDNSLAVLRDIPGLVIACPSTGADAAGMLRTCVRLARKEQRIVAFVEPIALYQQRDLHVAGDGAWMTRYPDPAKTVAPGDVGITGTGRDLAIVTYGNGHLLSRQAQAILADAHGVGCRVIDLRWLAPVPETALRAALRDVAAILVVDECRRTGGQAEGLMACLAEAGHPRIARLTAEDSFIATGPAHAATLPSRDGIVAAAVALVQQAADETG